MRRKIVILRLLILLFSGGLAQAEWITKDFYTDGQIADGNYFDVVNLWDSAVVDMIGGEVLGLYCYDASKLNLLGGSVSSLNVIGSNLIEMSAGSIGHVSLENSSVTHWSGGNITGYIGIRDEAILHVYGKDFLYTPGGEFGYGWLSGHWADDSDFTVLFRHLPESFPPSSSVILHEVPEPCSFGLLGLGFFMARKIIKPLRK